eukprot:2980139-Rhodomonas_salina.1
MIPDHSSHLPHASGSSKPLSRKKRTNAKPSVGKARMAGNLRGEVEQDMVWNEVCGFQMRQAAVSHVEEDNSPGVTWLGALPHESLSHPHPDLPLSSPVLPVVSHLQSPSPCLPASLPRFVRNV